MSGSVFTGPSKVVEYRVPNAHVGRSKCTRTLKFTHSSQCCGLTVIGRSGETIHNLQALTQCHIQVANGIRCNVSCACVLSDLVFLFFALDGTGLERPMSLTGPIEAIEYVFQTNHAMIQLTLRSRPQPCAHVHQQHP